MREDNRTGRQGFGLYQFQLCGVHALKNAFAAAPNNGDNPQPMLVKEAVLQQRLDQTASAVNQDVLAWLLFEFSDFFRNVAFDQRCRPPLERLGQRCRNDILVMLLILSAKSPVREGQAAANP